MLSQYCTLFWQSFYKSVSCDKFCLRMYSKLSLVNKHLLDTVLKKVKTLENNSKLFRNSQEPQMRGHCLPHSFHLNFFTPEMLDNCLTMQSK